MSDLKIIKSALISVYHKDKLDEIVRKLKGLDIKIYSTGGTKDYIEKLGISVISVDSITEYPSILGGRVKTLHPKIFGGILMRRDNETDRNDQGTYDIPEIDLVIVDLYPFEETVSSGADEAEIIEKIDIGGISLIRAASKNFADVLIVPSQKYYSEFSDLLSQKSGATGLNDRKRFARYGFGVSSHYDIAIFNYFSEGDTGAFRYESDDAMPLRYGENPHQAGVFYGAFHKMFDRLHGREISFNNILDLDAAVHLIDDFEETTFAVIKHNNACGVASATDALTAWKGALAGDPISAFGGIIVTNAPIDKTTAEEINKLFFEIIIAPGYSTDALDILKQKKNRIVLVRKNAPLPGTQFRTALNGLIFQDKDRKTEKANDMKAVTKATPKPDEYADLIFANKIVKHSKSNAITLVKNRQLLASGIGQTSRIDALRQAIEKATHFGFSLQGAIMASDAFFPFADSVEVAFNAGITTVIQPGGSVRDQETIDFCNAHGVAMVFTGFRHFKH